MTPLLSSRLVGCLRANWDAFNSLEWEPLVDTLHPAVHANRWPAADRELITLLATTDVPSATPVIELAHSPGARYVDLWNRREIAPELVDGRARLTVPLALDVPACVGVFRAGVDPAPYTPLDGAATGNFAPRDLIVRDGPENFFDTSRLISRVDRVVGPANQPADEMLVVPGGMYRMVVAT